MQRGGNSGVAMGDRVEGTDKPLDIGMVTWEETNKSLSRVSCQSGR